VPNLVTRREYVGGAAQTTITAGINASDTSISITSSSGWPTGATGPWVVAIDPGLSTEEKVLIQSRSGTTLTVAGSGRGYDGTSAVSHSSPAVIYPVFPAIEANELNEHASKSTTVHGVTGAVVGTTDTQTLSGKTLTTPTINGATLTGTVTLPAATMSDFTNANHDHGDADDGGLLPTAAPTASAVADSSVTGTATTYSRTDHKHAREAFGAVTAQTSFGAASADGAATTVARSDHTHGTPAHPAWTTFTPTWTASVNPAIGNGTLTGKYVQVGKTVHFAIEINMGSTTTYGTGSWNIGLPVTASGTSVRMAFPAIILDNSPAARTLGAGTINTTSDMVVIAEGNTGILASTAPITWASGDTLRISGTYEAA